MIEIRTPARLHLGLLDMNGELGRLYGSIGLAIQRPNVVLYAAPAHTLTIEGLETERVATFASRFLNHYDLSPKGYLKLSDCIPAHVGLGSGTQLALAVGTALAHLNGLSLSILEIAQVMGRGVHSGIGINTYVNGGFVLDGGHRVETQSEAGKGGGQVTPQNHAIPPVLVHQPVPESWRFVVTIPEAEKGLNGEREMSAFLTMPKAPPARVEKVCWFVLMKMLPAVVEQDIDGFGQAMTEIQSLVGQNFAPIQGGQYGNSLSERLIDFMLDQGAAGAGQSSWGPTVYGLVDGDDAAWQLETSVRKYLATQGAGLVFSVQPDNRGARLKES